MTYPQIKGGRSLSARIRAYPAGTPNDEIAADLMANKRTVAAVRAKQKKPDQYRTKANKAQGRKRRESAAFKEVAWAYAWAETFPPMARTS